MVIRSHQLARLALAATLLVTLAACGGNDDTSRQRNAALECIPDEQGNLPDGCIPDGGEQGQKLDCDAQWDPASGAVTLCADFRKIEVTQKDAKGKKIETGVAESDKGANAVQVDLLPETATFEIDVWTRNPAGNLRKAGSVSFEAATGALNTFSYTPDAAADPTSTTTAPEESDNELVMGYDFYNVEQSVDVSGLKSSDEVEFVVSYRLNQVTPGDDWLNIDMIAYDAAGKEVGYASEFNFPMRDTLAKTDGWQELKASINGSALKDARRIVVLMKGQDKGDRSGGHKGPRITSAELRINGEVKNANPGFELGTSNWSVRESSFMDCSASDGSRPCVTAMGFEQAFTEPTATTTTTEPAAPEETTTTTEAAAPEETTTTTEAPQDQPTPTTVLPPLLVEREPCTMDWVAAERAFVACRTFAAMKVAAYAEDGTYIGSVASTGSDRVVLDESQASAMRWAYFSVGTDIGSTGQALPVSRAREWMSFEDPGVDGRTDFQLDPEGQPELRIESQTEEFTVYTEEAADGGVRLGISTSGMYTLYVESGGKIGSNRVTVPAGPADSSYPWRAYMLNEFGMLSLVGSGALPGVGVTAAATVSIIETGALGLIRVSVGDDIMIEGLMGEVQEGAECANSQPVLFTDPNSPSGSNKVRLSFDTDCTATNGVAGMVIVDMGNILDDGFWASLAWGNFVSTRYSNRIEETVFLPNGTYSIFFFQMFPDNFKLSGLDYAVDASTAARDCDEPALVMSVDKKSARFTGCNSAARIDTYAYSISGGTDEGFDDLSERDLATNDVVVDLSGLGDGWWQVNLLTGRWGIAISSFAVCVTACEIEPGQATLDPTELAANGRVSVTDDECAGLEALVPDSDSTWRGSYVAVFMKGSDGGAHRLVHENSKSPESFPFTATARTGTPGEMLVHTYCQKFAWTGEVPTTAHSSTLSVVDASSVTGVRPANDDLAAALDVTGASSVEVDLMNATEEENEPRVSAIFESPGSWTGTSWLTFTAPGNGEMVLTSADRFSEEFTAGITVFRRDAEGRLGLVASNATLANFIIQFAFGTGDFDEFANVRFNVRAGEKYWVQLSSPGTWGDTSIITLRPPTEENWVAPSTTAAEPTTTTEEPATTEPPVTTTPQTSTTASTEVENVDTTVADTAPPTTQATGSPDTTAPTGPVTPQQLVAEGIKELVKEGARNEPAPVLAPEGDQPPRVEVREDAVSVTVSMQDLVASVTKSGVVLDPAAPIVVRTGNSRPKVFSPNRRSVTLPIIPGGSAQDIDVIATDADGKVVTSSIKIAKTVTPMVSVGDNDTGGGGFPVVAVMAALLALLAAAAAVIMRGRRQAAVTEETE
jgi:hypothetical protein